MPGGGLGTNGVLRDAIDTSTGVAKVGDELLSLSCWTADFCSAIIRAAELTGAFTANPHDPVPGHEVSLAVISPRLLRHQSMYQSHLDIQELVLNR